MNLTPFLLYAVLKFLPVAKATPANFALPKDKNRQQILITFLINHHTCEPYIATRSIT